MKTQKLALFMLTLLAVSCGNVQEESAPESRETLRIVSLKGVSSEILASLGCAHEIVGIDVTSVYPETLKTKENLGHVSGVSAQSILSLQPTLVIAEEAELNPETKSQLEMVGVRVHVLTQIYTPDGTRQLIKDMGKIVDKATAADSLLDVFNQQIKDVKKSTKQEQIVFIYARGAGTLMVAGGGTQMDALITLSGHANPFSHIDGFIPLTAEALVKANPDVLLFFTSGYESLGGNSGLSQIPGYDIIRAGKEKRIVHLDGSLASSFGPRLPQAIQHLTEAIEKLNAR